MNPLTRIIFIKKIIEYTLPVEKNEIAISKQLDILFCVNLDWCETVGDYLDDIWNQKDIYGNTVWHHAIRRIDSELFWNIVALQSDEWFEKRWDQTNIWKKTVWHYATKRIRSDKFWEIIANKPKDWFDKFWNQVDFSYHTVCDYAIENIESEKFWEITRNKLDLFGLSKKDQLKIKQKIERISI
jgi:hypothetical protein